MCPVRSCGKNPVLASMGMLESRRRLGTVVQPEESWNLYDPQVIRWRLASSGGWTSCAP